MQTLDKKHIKRSSALPIYIQISDEILERIESGQMPAGERFPSERDLSEQLGVNRMTLRKALSTLESQGLVERKQGDGTYVSEPKIERQADLMVSFSRAMTRRGYQTGADLLEFVRRPATETMARLLLLDVGDPVYGFLRLRTLNAAPVMLEKIWYPVARFPDLDSHDLQNRFIYDILEEEYDLSIRRGRQSLEPVVATEFEADLLEIEPGDPLMLENRLAFDQHDHPFEYGKDLYRGDRFRFTTERAPVER